MPLGRQGSGKARAASNREPGDLPAATVHTDVLGWRTKGYIMSSLTDSVALPAARHEALRYGIAAILLGILFTGITGFAPIQAIHGWRTRSLAI